MSVSRITEAKVKAAVKKALEPYKPALYAHWPVQHGYGAPTLDCNGAFKGRAFAIETKRPGQEPTIRQLGTIADMEAAGYKVFVVGTSAKPTPNHKGLIYSGMERLEEWLAGISLQP